MFNIWLTACSIHDSVGLLYSLKVHIIHTTYTHYILYTLHTHITYLHIMYTLQKSTSYFQNNLVKIVCTLSFPSGRGFLEFRDK